MTTPFGSGRTIPILAAGLALVLGGAAAVVAAVDPALWPEPERAFVMDGPGHLVAKSTRDRLLSLDEEERSRWIEDFLARDPVPETPGNELVEAIARRRALVFTRFETLLDERARVFFRYGAPQERYEVECGTTFRPLEVWAYPQEVTEKRLVFFEPRPGEPYRLWLPLDSKRALYTDEMVNWLEQQEELARVLPFGARRFDLKACPDGARVDEATGIAGLSRVRQPPTNEELLAVLEAPVELGDWVARALASETPEFDGLEATLATVGFPQARGQRIVTRLLLSVPAEIALGTVEGDDGEPEHRLVVSGVIEQDGKWFESFRIRYRPEPRQREIPLGLALERALRPNRAYLWRLAVEDEVSGRRSRIDRGVLVPAAVETAGDPDEPDEPARFDVVESAEEIERAPLAARNGLLLIPSDGRVVLGTWQAMALVSGDEITTVTFSVDGEDRQRRTKPPFRADLRLARFPRVQIVRAEGYAGDGRLIAWDEVVLNQAPGSFAIHIVEPYGDRAVSGRISVRAEVAVPETRSLTRLELRVNDELVEVFEGEDAEGAGGELAAELQGEIEVPEDDATAYLTVVAILDDGSRTEAVRFLHEPEFSDELEVHLVEMLVTVLDRDARPVSGLATEDFAVFEDGRPQTIDRLEHVGDLPLTVGFALDTSSSMATSLPEARRAALGFLESVLGPRDRAFLTAFAREPFLLVPPTTDLGAVRIALESLRSLGWTALHDAVIASLYSFGPARGQKALILISDGDDSASLYAFEDALEFARRSGIVVYTVGLDIGSLGLGVRRKLALLATETGGRAFFIRRAHELQDVYREIEAELRSQYLLTYRSDAPPGPKAFRTVELEVQGGKLRNRTLRGYYPN